MSKIQRYRVLIAGLVSPIAAVFLYVVVYGTLTQFSKDRERDWLFRLTLSAAAMMLPAIVTVALAVKERRRSGLSLSGKIGVAVAILSFGLMWQPASDGILRWKQSRNLALRDVPAPVFETSDIDGKVERLQDQRGKVVLVNIWATWCAPCRSEMPKLERLYRRQKARGFVVFGMSSEDVGVQRKFIEETRVTYPLLTLKGNVPGLYRDIARYPANFLIDRQGNLQPVPAPDRPFEELDAAVSKAMGLGTD
jgi:peroxiredoxin